MKAAAREDGGGGAARVADLGVDALYVVLCGAAGDDQALGDLAVRAARRDQDQDLDLALGEARRSEVCAAAALTLARDLEHRGHRVGVEPPGPRLSPELLSRPLRLPTPRGGARLRHRLEGVGGREDAGRRRQLGGPPLRARFPYQTMSEGARAR